MELPKEIFGVKPNRDLVAQAVRVYLFNQREGNADTKGRGEVRGGGKKPWRQKGTGRARAGSIRSPLWRGGGVVHGPNPRDFSLEMPKKMKRLALLSALSEKFANQNILIIDEINFKEPKTKEAERMLENLNFKGKNAIVLDKLEDKEKRALRNLAETKTLKVSELNTYAVLNFKKLLLTTKAVSALKEIWGAKDGK
jgi:large subunit ribosomal protein L4